MPYKKDNNQPPKSGDDNASNNGGNRSNRHARRRRPHPQDRTKPDWAEEVERADNYHSSQPKKGDPPKTRNRGPPEPKPEPGAHPILFDAATGAYPIVKRELIADWKGCVSAALRHMEITSVQPAMEQMASHRETAGVNDQTEYQTQYVAVGVLCAAQSMVNTTVAKGRSPENSNFMNRFDAIHASSMRTIQNQTGCVDDVERGEQWVYPHINIQVKRAVRTAAQILDHDDNDELRDTCDRAGENGFLPASDDDPLFDVQLREAVAHLLKEWGVHWIRVTPDLPVLTNANPPWWNLITNAQRNRLNGVFGARPGTQAQWVNRLNQFHVQLLDALGVSAGRAGAFVRADLRFDLDPRRQTTRIQDTWSLYGAAMTSYCKTSDRTALPNDGSLSQLANVRELVMVRVT